MHCVDLNGLLSAADKSEPAGRHGGRGARESNYDAQPTGQMKYARIMENTSINIGPLETKLSTQRFREHPWPIFHLAMIARLRLATSGGGR